MSQLCYCGFVYNGKRCRALIKKFPLLSGRAWHHPVGEYSRAKSRRGRER